MLDTAPVWLVVILITTGILIFGETGFRIGSHSSWKAAGQTPDELVVAAAYTLVALMLGFTFSMALGRFEARRIQIVHEASAIRTLALRSDLLDPKTASAIRADLHDYVDARLALVHQDADDSTRDGATARSEKIQDAIWRLVVSAAHADPHSTTVPLVIAALNDVSDIGDEEAAILTFYVPKSVMVMLITIALISSLLMGFRFGREGNRGLVVTATLALMLAISIGIVLDLGAPQHGGFIVVDTTPLRAVQRSLAP